MDDEEKNGKDLEELLKERSRIDELLKSRYSRDVTIMFSDIKGSTAVFESRGDIEGRAMIQQHNEMLFPLIERYGGRVLKTMGDAIMASFEEPVQAVRSAVDIQRSLFHYNKGREELDRIQVRIGIDTGRGLIESKDVFGEVVIVAARLENIAQPDQILISQQVYEKVKSSDQVICRYVGPRKLKGRTELLGVYRVVWGEEENGGEECLSASPSCPPEQRVNLGRGDTFKKGKDLLRLVNIIIFLIIMAGALSRIGFGIWKGSQDRTVQAAYTQLKLNNLRESKKSFGRLRDNNPVKYEGLAAVAYSEGDYLTALSLCEKSLTLDSETIYARVLKGNILLNRGQLRKASSEYEKAAHSGHGTNWQRAEAFQSLGKIAGQEGKIEDAFSYYQKAAEYDPSSPEVYTSQGIMMERAGKLDEALSYYQKALKVNPQDPVASVLFKEAKKRGEIAKDKDKQDRIDALVDDLLKASKEKGMTKKEADSWTSHPLTLTFLPLEMKGGLASLREGEDESIILRLTSSLQAEGKVKVVEREILDKLLEELKLSTTELVDQVTALKVGRILAARLIGTGSIAQIGSKTLLTLKLIETETTKVMVALSGDLDTTKDPDALIKKISREIISKLKKEYPLRGKIIFLEGDTVTMNIGSDEGVTKGLKMLVLISKPPKEKGEMAVVEVISVSPSDCQAKVIKKGVSLAVGSKLEEFIN
jgi:class 3 adenylate cyclase/tetratricopeptide (TPR) repeat protein